MSPFYPNFWVQHPKMGMVRKVIYLRNDFLCIDKIKSENNRDKSTRTQKYITASNWTLLLSVTGGKQIG